MDNNYNSTEWCSFGKNKCRLPFSSYFLLQHLGTIDGCKEEYYFHFSHTSNFNLFPTVKVFISTLRKDATILLESKSLEKKIRWILYKNKIKCTIDCMYFTLTESIRSTSSACFLSARKTFFLLDGVKYHTSLFFMFKDWSKAE